MQFSQDWKTNNSKSTTKEESVINAYTQWKAEASYLGQDKIAKPTDTVHIVSMNITSGEVRIVNLDCVKSSAT